MPDVVLEDSSRGCDSGEAAEQGEDDRFTTQAAHQNLPVNCDLNKDTAKRGEVTGQGGGEGGRNRKGEGEEGGRL